MIFYCVVNFRQKLDPHELAWTKKVLSKNLENLHFLQNEDGGFGEYGFGTSAVMAFINSFERFMSNRCKQSFVWNIKKIARQSLFRNKVSFSNSVIHCGSKMNESNIFATWFRLLTIELIEITLGLIDSPNDVLLKEKYARSPGLGYMPFTFEQSNN